MHQSTVRFAKISRPRLPEIASRPRLFSLLDKGRQRSIIWVGGSPGSGKTTLVADYLDTWAVDDVWYQADESDGDVATLFYYLSQTVGKSEDGADKPLPAFSPQYLSDLPAFTHSFFRDLYGRLAQPFALVIDNYQDVPEQSQFHEVMRDGLAEIPRGCCVVFISREDPPAWMARFRANQRMLALDQSDMLLTREESDAIISIRGYQSDEETCERLFQRTRGWVAGLVLMLEQRHDGGDLGDVPEDFTPQVIFDYLLGEVIERFDDHDQEFMLQTCFLPQITAEQAETLTKRTDSEDILHYLVQHDFFVTSRQSPVEIIYEFHPLLREFLLARAKVSLGKKKCTELRHRSAELLQRSGQLEAAINLRIENQEWDELVDLICAHASQVLEQGRDETLQEWLEQLPAEYPEQDPWMSYWMGACRLAHAPVESQLFCERAYTMFRKQQQVDRDGLFMACGGVLDAILYDLNDLQPLDHWISEVEWLLQEYPDFPEHAYGARVTSNMYLSLVYRQTSHPEITHWAERTLDVIEKADDSSTRLHAATMLCTGIVWTGRFNVVRTIIESIRQIVDEPGVPPMAVTTLHVFETMNYMLLGEHEKCLKAAGQGLKAAQDSGIHMWRNTTLIFGAVGAVGAGDLDTAENMLAEIDEDALKARRFDAFQYYFFRAWIAMVRGDLQDAFNQQRTALRLIEELGVPLLEAVIRMGMAQIQFELGDARKSTENAKKARKILRTIDNRLFVFQSLLIYAYLAFGYRRRSPGLRALSFALKMGRENNFSYTLWWQRRLMARLAVIALRHGIEPEYVKWLIVKRRLMPDEPPLDVEDWPWMFRVRTLGKFEIEWAGQPAQRRNKAQGRPLELLKVAIAFSGRDVPVQKITDAMWPHIDSDYANRSFNTTLHRLRNMLGEEQALILEGGRLSLNADFFWVDIWALEQASQQVSGMISGDIAGSRDDIKAAVHKVMSTYHGIFLSDEDASWAIGTREQVRKRFTRYTSQAVEYFNANDCQAEAIAMLERGLETDDRSESLYRQLMLCHVEQGRKAEAIEVYNRCRTTLEGRLGVTPSPETEKIYQQITG
jgi:ATP/maltotriose-dependent transcriptional regulator MalT/DNA-binding SARP family transcriptional activator